MDKQQFLAEIQYMLKKMDETDITFLKQLYTIIRRHLEKKGRL